MKNGYKKVITNGEYSATIVYRKPLNSYTIRLDYDGDTIGLSRRTTTFKAAKEIAKTFINSKC